MKFGYLIDNGPAYESHTLEAKSLIAAVEQLQNKVPVRVYQRAGQPDADFHVELWEDKGVERKNMSFEDLKEVYRLYPTASGRLVSSELCEKLWSELHAPGVTQTLPGRWPTLAVAWQGFGKDSVVNIREDWLGDHHPRGIDYLRYGDLGHRFGAQRLAEIGQALLESADLLTDRPNLTVSRLCNMVGITHEEAETALLVSSGDPYFTVCRYDEPMGRAADGEWYSTVEEAISCVQENMACMDLSLFLNTEKGVFPIGDMVDGAWQSPTIVSRTHLAEAQDAIAAVQAAEHIEYYHLENRLFFSVGAQKTPPTDIYNEFKLEARDQGVYDLDSALRAFKALPGSKGKTLFASYGHDVGGQCKLYHAPLLYQDRNKRLHFYDTAPMGHESVFMAALTKALLPKLFPHNEMQVGNWGVKLVPPGATYGDKNNLTNTSGKTLVEFYDRSQDATLFPGGQFVSRYYADTLLGRDGWGGACTGGLSLYADIPEWTVKGEDMRPILAWLEQKEDQRADQRKPSLADQVRGADARQKDAASHAKTSHKEKEDPHGRV